MAKNVTLASIRTQARQRSDMVNSQFISDSEFNSMINESASELFDLLVIANEDYYISSTTISVVPGTDTYDLPSDFYKVKGVDLVLGGNSGAVTLKAFSFEDRNAYLFTPTWNVVGLSYLRYHIRGNKILFVPVPNTSNSIKLWYIPVITTLTSDSDTLDGVDGWEEYIVVDVCIKALTKEESDVSIFLAQKAAIKQRIEQMSVNRDMGQPDKVRDVTKTLPWEFWSFGD